MTRQTRSERANNPEISFSIEIRPATIDQRAAGKRLFLRLIVRAQNNQQQAVTAKAAAAGGGGALPAASVDVKAQPQAEKAQAITNRGYVRKEIERNKAKDKKPR